MTKEQATKAKQVHPTSEGRASYVHLAKPQKTDNGEKYSIELLFPKAATDMSKIQSALQFAIVEKWGADKAAWPALQSPVRDGDKPVPSKPNEPIKPEYKGMWVVKANSDAQYSRPQTVGTDGRTLIDPSTIYSGCYVKAAIFALAYSHKLGKSGVKFVLDAVQYVRDGEALGSRRPVGEIFGSIDTAANPGAEGFNFGGGAAGNPDDNRGFM